MQIVNGSLFVTGVPFMFARWDLTADPENPMQIYAASDNVLQFSPDPPFGGWVESALGAGALGIFGNFAVTSGNVGASIIQVGPQVQVSTEVNRYPAVNSPPDAAYQYKAIIEAPIIGPQGPAIYGFTQQDGAVRLAPGLNPNGQPTLTPVLLNPYSPGGPVCCAVGATVFQNQLFLAMRTQVWTFSFDQGANLNRTGTMAQINPVAIYSTPNFLYIEHQPTSNGNQSMQAGVYVFDRNQNNVNYFPIAPLSFAVSPDDSHFYSNEDDMSVKIYRIQ